MCVGKPSTCAPAIHPYNLLFVYLLCLSLSSYLVVNKAMSPFNKPFVSHPRQRTPFIKGPIPLTWVQQAARLPGRTLHLGMILWYLAGVRRSTQGAVSYTVAEHFGLNRYTVYRGLARLEKAGLVVVSRVRGRRLGFTLLQASPCADS